MRRCGRITAPAHNTSAVDSASIVLTHSTAQQRSLTPTPPPWRARYAGLAGEGASGKLAKLYPISAALYPHWRRATTAWWAAARVVTDQSFGCATRRAALAYDNLGQPVYVYDWCALPPASALPALYAYAEARTCLLRNASSRAKSP